MTGLQFFAYVVIPASIMVAAYVSVLLHERTAPDAIHQRQKLRRPSRQLKPLPAAISLFFVESALGAYFAATVFGRWWPLEDGLYRTGLHALIGLGFASSAMWVGYRRSRRTAGE